MVMARMRRTEVFAADGYPIGSDRFRLDDPVAPHTHDFCELAVVLDGRGAHVGTSGRRRLHPGDVVAVRPGAWHGFTAVHGLLVANVYLGPELIAGDLGWILHHPALVDLLLGSGSLAVRLPAESLDRVAGWLSQLAHCRRTTDASSPADAQRAVQLQLRSLLGCVFAEFVTAATAAPPSAEGSLNPRNLRRVEPPGPGGVGARQAVTPRSDSSPIEEAAAPSPGDTRNGAVTAPVRTALLAMAGQPARPWTMAELAALAHVSPSHLQHQFAAQLGISVLGWLQRYRAEQMAVRLAAGSEPIAEIGRAVGWPDPNYAARRFRAHHAMSPTQYRRRFSFDALDGATS